MSRPPSSPLYPSSFPPSFHPSIPSSLPPSLFPTTICRTFSPLFQYNCLLNPYPSVFASISAPLSRLKAASGALLFDLCTAAPEKMVADLRFDDAWSVGSIQFIEKSDGNTDKRLFNTLSSDNFMPLPSITQVWFTLRLYTIIIKVNVNCL